MSGTNLIIGGAGVDEIKPGSGALSPTFGADSIDGKDGNDIIEDPGGTDTIIGGLGNDKISDKGFDSDIIDGGAGFDEITTEGGNDTVFANENDIVSTGSGNDLVLISGSTGANIQVNAGDDTVFWDGTGNLGYAQGGSGTNTLQYGGTGQSSRMFFDHETGPAQGFIYYNQFGFNAAGQALDSLGNPIPGPLGTGVQGRLEYQDFGGGVSFVSTTPTTAPPCFTTGTRIATTRGEVAVEDLRVGDLVLTPRAGAKVQPIIWIGHTRVNVAAHPKRETVAPILVKEGAIAEGVPHRDLRVSPEHAFFIDGRLIPAKHLVNGSSIVQEAWCPQVTYWHVELPQHAVIVSEGAPTESYFDDGSRQNFDNGAIAMLFKDFESHRGNGRYDAEACYPLLRSGTMLELVRGRLMARAAELERRARATG